MQPFKLKADYRPTGDQPTAIAALETSIRAGTQHQMLLGVTGSGKTFTMANLIEKVQRPTLILSHNKTLAAQLYSEFKEFFPENAVEYFVSYYDYYQPEAYIPQTDTFIEKDSAINEDLDRLRIAATSALVSREDVIVVASVSCIYGLGSPEDFTAMMIPIHVGAQLSREQLMNQLVENLYQRNDIQLKNGNFRVRGDVVDIYPAWMEHAIRVEFWGDEVEGIAHLNPVTGEIGERLTGFHLYPANPYVTPKDKVERAVHSIRAEMEARVAELTAQEKLVEAQRLRMRTEYDLEMLGELGFCTGIENYSRHLDGRAPGTRPSCLLDFFPKDFLCFIDESHVTIPQVHGMYNGDRARKERLVEHGFRLPSAIDNRPLMPPEFAEITGQMLYVSATPAPHETELCREVNGGVTAEQLIRPTGLVDPPIELRPINGQVEDLMGEIQAAVKADERVLVTTLTKRMTEDLAEYLRGMGIRCEYLHSDIDAIERVEILRKLRKGQFNVLIGVNLLREGLDLPEVGLVAIMDADKEGFLRSATSLIQTAGRAARHEKGRVILYADVITKSIQKTLDVTEYRRGKQLAYNKEHGITPTRAIRKIEEGLPVGMGKGAEDEVAEGPGGGSSASSKQSSAALIAELTKDMLEAAESQEYERAAVIKEQIASLRGDDKRAKKTARRKSRRA